MKFEGFEKEFYDFEDLKEIVEILRGENGCPWDREQTIPSLRKYMIEECYEAVDASKSEDKLRFADELGDVLLQVLMNASIARDNGDFDIATVTDLISKKMISRHPHVFGDAVCETSADVMSGWEKGKKQEKQLKTVGDVLDDIPKSHPSLLLGEKVSSKLAKTDTMKLTLDESVGLFEDKVKELTDIVKNGDFEKAKDRFCAMLFSATNLAYTLGVTSEENLHDKVIDVIGELKKVPEGDTAEYKKVFKEV